MILNLLGIALQAVAPTVNADTICVHLDVTAQCTLTCARSTPRSCCWPPFFTVNHHLIEPFYRYPDSTVGICAEFDSVGTVNIGDTIGFWLVESLSVPCDRVDSLYATAIYSEMPCTELKLIPSTLYSAVVQDRARADFEILRGKGWKVVYDILGRPTGPRVSSGYYIDTKKHVRIVKK